VSFSNKDTTNKDTTIGRFDLDHQLFDQRWAALAPEPGSSGRRRRDRLRGRCRGVRRRRWWQRRQRRHHVDRRLVELEHIGGHHHRRRRLDQQLVITVDLGTVNFDGVDLVASFDVRTIDVRCIDVRRHDDRR
jgi:hypothetical protein